MDVLTDYIEHHASSRRDDIAFRFLGDGVNETQSMTYGELSQKTQAVAQRLMQMKLGAAGERALLIYQPGLDFIVSFLGCMQAGLIPVAIFPPQKNANSQLRTDAIIHDVDPRVVLTTMNLYHDLSKCNFFGIMSLKSLPMVPTDLLQLPEQRLPLPKLDPQQVAFIQYTSGTVSQPKGVPVSHANLVSNVKCIAQMFHSSSAETLVNWLPTYNDMGLVGGVLTPLLAGCETILLPPRLVLQQPKLWLAAISKYKATSSGAPNYAYDFCVRNIDDEQIKDLDLSHWRIAYNGGESVKLRTIERFGEKFAPAGFKQSAFFPCYGMAESTLLISGDFYSNLHVCDETGLVSVGHLADDHDLLICDPQSHQLCDPGVEGEILIRGPSVVSQYWNESLFLPRVHIDEHEQPYLRTGDLGFIADGELVVRGRIKDLIEFNGHVYYPSDLEELAYQEFPEIMPNSIAAFIANDSAGERVHIALEPNTQLFDTYQADYIKLAIKRKIYDKLSLVVWDVHFVKPGELPRTSSGKVQRLSTQQLYLKHRLHYVDDALHHDHSTDLIE